MAHAFGEHLRALRTERKILQSAFAQKCAISPAYLSDIERGRRNPPADKVILEWAGFLDPGKAEEIGQELIELAARDQERAEAVTEEVVEEAGMAWGGVARSAGRTQGEGSTSKKKSGTPFLDYFGVDLVELAGAQSLDPAPGRSWEFGEIACVISRRRGNSVVLSSATGAEVYRVVQGLACEMAAGRAPAPLAGKRLLKVEGLQVGVKYRGQFEERLKALKDEVVECGDALLYFHSLGDLVELEGNARGSFFCPALLEGNFQVITGATAAELKYCHKTNAALAECFRVVPVRPLEREGVLRGLHELCERYGAHHQVKYSAEALEAIADAATKGDAATFWPRALDLLDEVGARLHLEGREGEIEVAKEDVAECAAWRDS